MRRRPVLVLLAGLVPAISLGWAVGARQEGPLTIPWRGALARQYWRDQWRSGQPVLECQRIYGDEAEDSALHASGIAQEGVAHGLEHLPTHAETYCVGVTRDSHHVYDARMRAGRVLEVGQYWREPLAGDSAQWESIVARMAARRDSIAAAVTARLGPPRRCARVPEVADSSTMREWRTAEYVVRLWEDRVLEPAPGPSHSHWLTFRASEDSPQCPKGAT
jgi:hypothetical protein